MTKFKTVAVSALIAAFLLSASSSLVQEVRFNDIDRYADGVLSEAELRSIFGSRGQVILAKERNGDGVVSRSEVRGGWQSE